MKPLKAEQIVGSWAPVMLPLNDDDTIDYTSLAEQIDYLCASKVSGIYSNGTSGEFYCQSEEEFDRLNGMMAQRCEKAGIPFQIGASHMSPTLCLERAKRAAAMAPGAIQVILPDWSPCNDEEAAWFLERIAQACDPVGVVLYNPPHAKRVLEPAAIGRLKQAVPALRGVKVLGGDQAWYDAMARETRDLSVFVAGHALGTWLGRGAHGSYSNVAAFHPRGAQRWYEMILKDRAAALEMQDRIVKMINMHIAPWRGKTVSAARDKFAAAIGGWAHLTTRMRWPYHSIPMDAAVQARPVARRLVPELFDDRP